MTSARFTRKDLEAIEEAMSSRLAGERDNENEPDAPTTEAYEAAWEKVAARLGGMK